MQSEPRTDTRPCRIETPPLSATVRRHLGKSLRSHYAAALAEPVSERLEAVLAKLEGQKG
nr:hypothetical protein [Methylobacterium haplocladii]